jgi:hypothetical protein
MVVVYHSARTACTGRGGVDAPNRRLALASFVLCLQASPVWSSPLSSSSRPPAPPSWRYEEIDAWPDLCTRGREQSPVELSRQAAARPGAPRAVSLYYPDDVAVQVVTRGDGCPQLNVMVPGSAWIELRGVRHYVRGSRFSFLFVCLFVVVVLMIMPGSEAHLFSSACAADANTLAQSSGAYG